MRGSLVRRRKVEKEVEFLGTSRRQEGFIGRRREVEKEVEYLGFLPWWGRAST